MPDRCPDWGKMFDEETRAIKSHRGLYEHGQCGAAIPRNASPGATRVQSLATYRTPLYSLTGDNRWVPISR